MLEVLVIDDERSFGEMLRTLLSKEGYSVTYLSSATNALNHIAGGR
ncbi:MAG TPA: response regulator [Myxococcales bacterium]|nr:response regulator [Myxococcales bacterium]